MAIAAEIGFKMSICGLTLLSLLQTVSIASGMPWPMIRREPYFAISPAIRPPSAGTRTIQCGSPLFCG